MAALCAQLRAMASASAAWSPASRASACPSSQSRNGASVMAPYFTTSARPARNSRAGRVASAAVSASTVRGGWKAPTRFLPWGRSTAVLPPTDESTMASRVVGSCTQSMPRIQQAAAKPARSPITPPPRANTQASRRAPSPARASITRLKEARVLEASPAGSTRRVTARPGTWSRSAASTRPAYSGATTSSLTTSACRPRRCRARAGPSASRPGAIWIG